ncbi:hypothetical protein HBI56_001770 [Parastagonospora nodorum]|uniref:Uncharacterized protein n=1 Tax=Phaeosphaeria nodorum (strain SN15 / ATCC MYA-4574 / FGSC 10173) TaxID=321614 RepID=A0A7U2HV51_PHANO|nr:hypothetical protein HBH56_139320 [Parastagonospora nodorum]QRC91469.1 hypothetical protein JI435_401360 [Parastagonospora nodorum SN15]KAH3928237.1 hypothetical protein HBH54_144460 [Parastagonospora nodorum]KAH3949162.1 hypothetical protein HBH53_094460 [Parastagonospora nodorum]KAH3983460.1 hypothetical protein HBH51_033710 [Parastagonospora nodorum]
MSAFQTQSWARNARWPASSEAHPCRQTIAHNIGLHVIVPGKAALQVASEPGSSRNTVSQGSSSCQNYNSQRVSISQHYLSHSSK